MKVTLIDKMGTDLTVVNAARVSFAKKSKWEDEAGRNMATENRLTRADIGLISFLARHNHWTPFGHCSAQFHIKAPIFVARQLVKHQVGLVWNEVSRRYVNEEPEFWYPENMDWRLAAKDKKQGSREETIHISELSHTYAGGVRHAVSACAEVYRDLLARGVAPELARIVLPINLYTEWYWTGTLAAWARVCKLRLDPHAQAETREIAVGIDTAMRELFPVSWEALMSTEDKEKTNEA